MLKRPQQQQLEQMAARGDPRAIRKLEELAQPARAVARFDTITSFKVPRATRAVVTLNPLALEVIRSAGLPEPITEYQFNPDRKFKFDFCWLEQKVALEAEGMAHRTKERFQSDLVKYNSALSMGWRVFRATRVTLENPDVLLKQLKAALLARVPRQW